MSVSGLSSRHVVRARDLACEAALLSIHRNDEIHYTQGARRWEGIDRNLKAWRGQIPKFADCSSIATWWLWNGLDHYGVRDTVNGTGWRAGFTGTMLTHGQAIHDRSDWQRGDLLIYNGHVGMHLGGGEIASHGSEMGPLRCDWNYRHDLMAVRRAI